MLKYIQRKRKINFGGMKYGKDKGSILRYKEL